MSSLVSSFESETLFLSSPRDLLIATSLLLLVLLSSSYLFLLPSSSTNDDDDAVSLGLPLEVVLMGLLLVSLLNFLLFRAEVNVLVLALMLLVLTVGNVGNVPDDTIVLSQPFATEECDGEYG